MLQCIAIVCIIICTQAELGFCATHFKSVCELQRFVLC